MTNLRLKFANPIEYFVPFISSMGSFPRRFVFLDVAIKMCIAQSFVDV